MVHKYYGIRDDKEVRRGTVISTFFALLVAGGGYFIGSFSHLFFGDTMPEGGKDYIIPNMLNMAGLPNILIGIVLVLSLIHICVETWINNYPREILGFETSGSLFERYVAEAA